MRRDTPIFGVAGNPPNFWSSEFSKDRLLAPAWVSSIGLSALELQSTRGVKMPLERAHAFRAAAAEHGVTLSIHGPYYISLGTPDDRLIENSLNELRKCVELCRALGAVGAVFHPGRIGAADRRTSLDVAIAALKRVKSVVDVGDVRLFPEIAGKKANLGSLDEILEICEEVECCWPCLDLAHQHARTNGSLKSREDFEALFDLVESRLGREGLEKCHFHFYPIEWGERGEIRHRAFADIDASLKQLPIFENMAVPREDQYLPRFEPFLDTLFDRELNPIIICEAKDTQDVGALAMKAHWEQLSRSVEGAALHD